MIQLTSIYCIVYTNNMNNMNNIFSSCVFPFTEEEQLCFLFYVKNTKHQLTEILPIERWVFYLKQNQCSYSDKTLPVHSYTFVLTCVLTCVLCFYFQYLDQIGQLFFGLPPPPKQSQGFLGKTKCSYFYQYQILVLYWKASKYIFIIHYILNVFYQFLEMKSMIIILQEQIHYRQ